MGNELLLGEIIATSSRNEFKRWLEMLSGRGVGGRDRRKSICFTFIDLKRVWKLSNFYMTS